ncbi:MAG TPA: hypothetical protein VKP69_06550, partial [Isosphaeraceae bacterium]|nr:hypothetical protein [Isosphaeraceae bacterium]
MVGLDFRYSRFFPEISMPSRCLATAGLILMLASCSPSAQEPTIIPIGDRPMLVPANPAPTVAEDKKADDARTDDKKADAKKKDVSAGELIEQARRST